MSEHWLEDYARIERAIHYLGENYRTQPSLAEVASYAGLSEYHFQRMFTRWAGISPKKYLQYLTKEHARKLLSESGDLLEAAYGSGLSGPSRLHDLFVTFDAVTPGELKRSGSGLEIIYGFHPSPFGEFLLALTQRGICRLVFLGEGGREQARADLYHQWPYSTITESFAETKETAERVFPTEYSGRKQPLTLYAPGTNFQVKVWEALIQIPSGKIITYETIAAHLGSPRASRAVGSAVASNPINYLIPCHRVIRKAGEFGQYQSGADRKKAILAWEFGHQEMGHQEMGHQ